MEDLQSILLPGIDSKRPIIIAGPCSAETEEQVMTTAKSLAERGIKIFRAGIWKPRTKPGGFEGIGVVRVGLCKVGIREHQISGSPYTGFQSFRGGEACQARLCPD